MPILRLAACVVIAIVTLAVLLVFFFWAHSSPQSQPKWDFAFPYDGNVAVDMRFSPDCRSLAVVSADAHSRHYRKQAAWIYEVPTGKLRHTIEGGAWQCAWNADGSILAVAGWTGWEFDLWDAKTWTRKRHLEIKLSPAEKQIVRFVPPSGLCFDGQGSFYAADPYNGWDGFVPVLNRAKVWWNTRGPATDAGPLGTCSEAPLDVSVSSGAGHNRIVISHEDPGCTLEVLVVENRAGKRIVRQACKLDVAQAHGLVRPSVFLTADGKYLAARDDKQFCLFELSDHQAKLVYSLAEKTASLVAGAKRKVLDVSLNGRFAAFDSDHRIRVVHISDGASALEIQQEPESLALSPDGRLLAVSNEERKAILFYRIPQEKHD